MSYLPKILLSPMNEWITEKQRTRKPLARKSAKSAPVVVAIVSSTDKSGSGLLKGV